MKGLNKVNCFNRLEKEYPHAHYLFAAWIDEQKFKLNWNLIFNSHSDYQDMNGKNAPAPKFHDLPFELQFGIICNFIGKCTPHQQMSFNYDLENTLRLLTDAFRRINNKVEKGILDIKQFKD